jgi:hypothetical protein
MRCSWLQEWVAGSVEHIFGVGRVHRRPFMQHRRVADNTCIHGVRSRLVRPASTAALLKFKPWSAAVALRCSLCAIVQQMLLSVARNIMKY